MPCTIIKEFMVTVRDPETGALELFRLYSDRDLTSLDSTLHYCVSIKATGEVGLGSDGVHTHDGKPLYLHVKGKPAEMVTKGMSLAETDRIMAAHKEMRSS
jgi:hypothetical protein